MIRIHCAVLLAVEISLWNRTSNKNASTLQFDSHAAGNSRSILFSNGFFLIFFQKRFALFRERGECDIVTDRWLQHWSVEHAQLSYHFDARSDFCAGLGIDQPLYQQSWSQKIVKYDHEINSFPFIRKHLFCCNVCTAWDYFSWISVGWLLACSVFSVSIPLIPYFYVMAVCFMIFLSCGLCGGIISAISVTIFPTNIRWVHPQNTHLFSSYTIIKSTVIAQLACIH